LSALIFQRFVSSYSKQICFQAAGKGRELTHDRIVIEDYYAHMEDLFTGGVINSVPDHPANKIFPVTRVQFLQQLIITLTKAFQEVRLIHSFIAEFGER
jgi:hypothetical protein